MLRAAFCVSYVLLATALTVGLDVGIVCAQQPDSVTLPPVFREPMPLYEVGLGKLSWPISTRSKQAQAYFDQGLQLLYSFTPEDAARSFREAQKLDPACAMCFFGEAWAWGPYLNGAMLASNAPRAHAAAQRAMQLRGQANDLERALIDAMTGRFTARYDSATHHRLAVAYSEAMARVYDRHPSHLEVGTLYAEALMLLEPRRVWDIEKPSVRRIHEVLEAVLSRDVNHPGACHLLIHATESTVRAGRAEQCANLLGQSIPGASHINHMPSHTFNRIGRWGDAVRANIEAWHSDQRAQYGAGFAIYPSHNLHMLLFSASYDGQGAIAIQAGKDYAKIVNGGSFYHALTLFRFGRFDEILELRAPPTQPINLGLWNFARGYAHLRQKNVDSARVYQERVENTIKSAPATMQFRGHTAASLLGITSAILQAELLRHEGRTAEAVPVLERAVELEEGLRYDEPEPLNFSARHWLGAILLELNRPVDAERVYRAELEDRPHNGWSLFGLEQALRAQNRSADAARVREAFARSWARADALLRASRF
jgi:tetratricopeptide (TPR) repeat protein